MGAGQKLSVLQLLMVIAVSLVGLLAVFIFVPLIADAAGLNDRHVNYAMAGAAFLIAVAAGRWAKSLTKKSSERN
jgi:hypothetical protein